MEIIFKAVHGIDYEENMINSREIPDTFDRYVRGLVAYVTHNKTVRFFKSDSQNTLVLNNINQILHQIDTQENETKRNFDDIARKLLNSEVETQEGISRLGKKIKRGSLIQALLKEGETYQYLLAKVEHNEFVDDEDLSFKMGFATDEKKIWKTCIFDFSVEDGIFIIDSIRVYLDTNVKYWPKKFLELQELRNNEINTQQAFKNIDSNLKRYLKKDYPKDFMVLRNAVIGKFRVRGLFDYDLMVTEIFENYVPQNIPVAQYENFMGRIKKLPDIMKFDRQFESCPERVNAKICGVYKVNPSVEIKIMDHVGDLDDVIKAEELDDGTRILKIKITEKEIFEAFA